MAWAFVQSAIQHVNSGANAKAFTSNVSAGSVLIADIYLSDGAATVSSVTDTNGNTWAAIGSIQVMNGAGLIYYAKNATAGATTVTVTPSTGGTHVLLHEYSGLDTSAPLEANVSATGTSTATADSGAATVTAGSLVHGFIFALRVITAGSGFTERTNDAFFNDVESEDRTAPGGSVNVTATLADATGTWAAFLAAFKLPAAAGGNRMTRMTLGIG